MQYKKQEPGVSLDHPKIACAVFYICCKANKFAISKAKVCLGFSSFQSFFFYTIFLSHVLNS